jgi:hypothetical protein
MAKVDIILKFLDKSLRPLGFHRTRKLWSRRNSECVELINIQTSKYDDKFTLNFGVLDIFCFETVWCKELPKSIDVPDGTVSARIGELIDNRDKWWELDDPAAAQDVSEHVLRLALPFLESKRSRTEMRDWLVRTEVVKKRYPYPIISLGILEILLDEKEKGCAILSRITDGGWGEAASRVADQLSCGGRS